MPLTPFLGLSVIVHLVVIAWNASLERLPPRFRSMHTLCAKKETSLGIWILGYLIIFGVAVFVLTSASVLVGSSLSEKHSTLYVVQGEIGAVQDYLSAHPKYVEETRVNVVESFRGLVQPTRAVIALLYLGISLAIFTTFLTLLPHLSKRVMFSATVSDDAVRLLLMSAFSTVIFLIFVVAVLGYTPTPANSYEHIVEFALQDLSSTLRAE